MLKRLSADQVAVYMEDWQNVQKNAPYLKQAVSYFSEHGFGLSLWINGFMHDGFQGNSTRMEYADGLVGKLPCPLDANFRAHYASLVKEYAATGVRLIFIDDDFRMHISEGIGCFCPLHMVRYRALLGDVTQEEVRRGVLDRKPNRYRTAWQKINGETLCDFARFLRREVDSVDATVRLGLCTSPTVLDMDGVKSDELACILAGGTRPFLRLIARRIGLVTAAALTRRSAANESFCTNFAISREISSWKGILTSVRVTRCLPRISRILTPRSAPYLGRTGF